MDEIKPTKMKHGSQQFHPNGAEYVFYPALSAPTPDTVFDKILKQLTMQTHLLRQILNELEIK